MSRDTRLARLLWLALLGWACGILWLSSLTPDELPSAAHLVWDKLNHFLAYALGGWLAANAIRLSRPSASVIGTIVTAVVLIAAFGALDELWQEFTPGRSGGDLYDWIADALGATVGAALTLVPWCRRRCPPKPATRSPAR
ncbi:MAG: VanZ family protein [Mycobacterium sp.]|nr:VanZ family protein [Mycobacterium sp.]